MKAIKWTLALIISLPIGASQYLSAQPEASGTMMVVKGDIQVASAKSGKTEKAKVGFKVYSGDTIQSGPDSRAKIIMSDKNVLNISPDSKMTIAKYENNPGKDSRNVELKVDYGKVRASVSESYDGEKNKFNIRTPTAVAGVRGTDFITGFNPQTRSTQVITFSGVVAVGQLGAKGTIINPVFVQPGQSTNVGEGAKASAPVSVPKDQMQNMEKDSDAEKSAGGSASTAAAASPQASTNSGGDKAKEAPAERAPASVPAAPSMIDAKDLDTSISKDIKAAPERPKAPTVFAPTTQPTVVGPIQNQFIDNAIRSGPAKVDVKICLPGTSC